MTPDYCIGCKRILISNEYLPSLTQPNVDVVAAGLAEVRERFPSPTGSSGVGE